VAIIAYIGFLCSGEFIYKAKDLRNKRAFQNISLLQSDIIFNNLDKHIILLLKQSKTNYNHVRVNIIIAAIGTLTYPIQALQRLFKEDSQPINSPLFQLSSGPLSYQKFVSTVHQWLQESGIADLEEYSGYSFCRGAAI